MAPEPATVTYLFHLAAGRDERITLRFAPETHLLLPEDGDAPPAWTHLAFHPCAPCPLAPTPGALCPFARALGGFVHRFDAFYSYERAVVEVITAQRTMVAPCSLQEALASIAGLIGATSGCPLLAFFRPMARFHLPFASEQETLVRAFSLHLLGEYLKAGGSGARPVSVEALEARYAAVSEVNRGMANRLRAAFSRDAAVNAIIILDTFAQAVPFVAGEALAELRPLFEGIPAPPPRSVGR
ncbi:DUF6901 family protein [Pararhodospirillum oryzae]|uniref:Uncharacterized protein n=1 Tax=Pararhodospirillum oryzae TaxID=478448 RepID=A0A512H8Q8_9PROT|nr:hypothetical protein [Pararhodospirillum oryzae]GEO81834.1 hypothetical protein ROR02_19650 [Pararhodospirillum oryzae]